MVSENELISREVVQGYAKCTSDVCVRMGWSKNSEFLTTLKKGTFVWIFEINYNRANIYFGEQNGWCTIFLENEQRFLLSQQINQKQAKELYNAQFMDIVDYDVDMYEEEYLFSGMDFGNVFDAFHNLRYKKIIEKQKSKFWKKHFKSIADPKMEEDLYMSKKDDSKEQQRVRRNRIKFKRVLNEEYEEWERKKVVRESEAKEKRRVKLERYVEELREKKKAELESEQEQLENKNANLQYYIEELEKMKRQEEEARIKRETEEKQEKERREAEEAALRKSRQEEWTQRLNEVKREEYELLEAQSIPLRNYLMKHVMPTLTQGLIDCCKTRPDDPIDALAEYLFQNNPQVD